MKLAEHPDVNIFLQVNGLSCEGKYIIYEETSTTKECISPQNHVSSKKASRGNMKKIQNQEFNSKNLNFLRHSNRDSLIKTVISYKDGKLKGKKNS